MPLTPARRDFLELILEAGVLRFGSFKTKSGRTSPFFFNTGSIQTGPAIARLARSYASVIAESFPDADNLFGPAYKGIPLAVATSVALSEQVGRAVSFTFDRKEEKDHGEGGGLVGYCYEKPARVVIVEDVLTGGTSLRHTLELLGPRGVRPIGAVVGIDREERGVGNLPARREIEEKYGLKVVPLLTLTEIVAELQQPVLGRRWIDEATLADIGRYRSQYG